jgi:hypothetical protein
VISFAVAPIDRTRILGDEGVTVCDSIPVLSVKSSKARLLSIRPAAST